MKFMGEKVPAFAAQLIRSSNKNKGFFMYSLFSLHPKLESLKHSLPQAWLMMCVYRESSFEESVWQY